jgi:hypothetical protein
MKCGLTGPAVYAKSSCGSFWRSGDRRDSMSKRKGGDIDGDPALDLHAALGQCISTWMAVEVSVESVLQACLPKAEAAVVAAVYTSVDNFRAKAGMADAALKVVLRDQPSVLAEWSRLRDRLEKKQRIRNFLAHGAVQHWFTESGDHKIYITRSFLNPHHPPLNIYDPRHGYCLEDLKKLQHDFVVLCNDLMAFRNRLDGPVALFQKSSKEQARRAYKRVLKTLKGADPKDPQLRRSFGL